MATTGFPRRLLRSWRTTVPFGIGAGTLYFIMIGALTIFTSVLSSAQPSLFGLVLFVGVGAALGLLLGLVSGISLAVVIPHVHGKTAQRLVGALAVGLPVLAFTVWEYTTETVGVLLPDITTVIAVPTIVASIASAAMAPGLAEQTQPKRPEM